MKLKDRVAIVTGGGKGIGQEICLGLVKEGAKIVIAEIDVENSDRVEKEWQYLLIEGKQERMQRAKIFRESGGLPE